MPFWALRAWRRWVSRKSREIGAFVRMVRTGDPPFFGGPYDGASWRHFRGDREAPLSWVARLGFGVVQVCMHYRGRVPRWDGDAMGPCDCVGGYLFARGRGRMEWCDGREPYLARLRVAHVRIDASRYFDGFNGTTSDV